MSVQRRLEQVEEEIHAACERSHRSRDEVEIITVTKYATVERTQEVLDAGLIHIGENRAESGVEKWHALNGRGNWHFIGQLQSRKVKEMIDQFDTIHSLDRLSLAKEIQKRAKPGRVVDTFVQVNVSGESSKSGIRPEDTVNFIEELEKYSSIRVIGLMTMAPYAKDTEETRPIFRHLKELQQEVKQSKFSHAPCHHLSMGMSNDYEVAIEEGATFVRIGSALVGEDE
ncbi:YggS family pyridoxal phosphate-dependent enzyme [Texcoconibacillus texcoconensis]|uniref:Pyridoxal phosphate homeostasis protein n=1 Tax=Texcoconibacillus texcoconensis TaxID=1095777 RepID=A0A840QLB6_9BACI|nr:YggS family pyridoxal phosphate-dependent enzyme [Texcoconibacillus texcoconensis]MBB5172159.1 hypothetical protein [Texcoconibacillus texcoconensis]